jgi:hypothetical protein
MEPMMVLHEECEIHGLWITILTGSNNGNTTALKASHLVIFMYYHKIPAGHTSLSTKISIKENQITTQVPCKLPLAQTHSSVSQKCKFNKQNPSVHWCRLTK